MKYGLLGVIGLGTAIGLALPGARTAPPKPALLAAEIPTRRAAPPRDAQRDTVIERGANGHFIAFADVNDEPIRFVVDTGATTVALTLDDARRAGVAFDPGQFAVVGQGASGDVRGQDVVLRDVVLDGKRAEGVHALVVDRLGVSLLGQNYLRHLDTVSISGDTMTLR